MKKMYSLSDRLRYWFDNTMARGMSALIGWLAVLTIVIVLISSIFVWISSTERADSFSEQVWSFGLMALDIDISFDHWPLGLALILLVFTSIFVLSTLIGLLTAGIEAKLENLRKGRSVVVETGHTLLLGWSNHVFPIVSELVVSNENQKDSCVVILADQDKVEMEEAIRDRVGNVGRMRIVCRRGDPTVMGDLDIVSINTAKSIVILPSSIKETADTTVIKILLAIIKNPARRPEPYHITSAIHESKNIDIAKIVGTDEVELVDTRSMIARIIAQTSRQKGLSDVYQDLFDFQGNEIYFQSEADLVGKTYGDALLAYEESAAIGLHLEGGKSLLNPPMNTVIQRNDQIVAVTGDDDAFSLSMQVDRGISHDAIPVNELARPRKEQCLIIGWNHQGFQIIKELDSYVPKGSSVTIVSDATTSEAVLECNQKHLFNQSCTFQEGDTTDRAVLEALPLRECNHVILLASSDTFNASQADERTLVTLLLLSDIATLNDYKFSVISEILDVRNRDLVKAARVDDFVVSDRLISLVLSQISENKFLAPIFEELLTPEGAEIYLNPASKYVALDQEHDFYAVIAAASQFGETAIGYRRQSEKESASHGVVLNPHKARSVSFTEQDRIIVLAND